jgi:hypothetical protein
LYDADSGWKKIARLFAWEVGVNGCLLVGLVWFGSSFSVGFSTGAGGFYFLVAFFSIRRGDSGIGLDFSCTYTRMRSLALFSFERY